MELYSIHTVVKQCLKQAGVELIACIHGLTHLRRCPPVVLSNSDSSRMEISMLLSFTAWQTLSGDGWEIFRALVVSVVECSVGVLAGKCSSLEAGRVVYLGV